MIKSFLILIFSAVYFILCGQQIDLPIGFAEWELNSKRDFQAFSSSSIQNPPISEVRSMAEWEEAQALLITWTSYPSILAKIVKAAQEEGTVIIVCSDSSDVKTSLTANQVDIDNNIKYLIAPFNSVWIRDYGPNTVYKNDVDSLYLVDWIYNRPRYKDDTVSTSVAKFLNVPLYSTYTSPYDLVNTGGNFMSDGSGNGFASGLVIDENGKDNKFGTSDHNEAEIDTIMNKFMGIGQYIIMPKLPNDGIHHIDMHMKLLDENTLLVGQYPKGLPDEPQIEANIQYIIDSINTIFGSKFNIIRIPMPPYSAGNYPGNGFNRTYTNAVFFNKTVIIPSYEEKYDTTAIRIWQEALPGYTIAPVNCNSPITAGGAVHCITKEIGVADPLRIVHNPFRGELDYSSANKLLVKALIQHISGINEAKIWYRSDTISAFQSIDMKQNSDDSWVGELPAFQKGTEVHYYIEATSNSGKTRYLPMPAPKANYTFRIKGSSSNTELVTNPEISEIYPNPASAITCIPLKYSFDKPVELYLADSFGRRLKTIFKGKSARENYFIDAADLNPGVYFIVLRSINGIQTQKLIVR
jgi:agmatine deiminase